MDQSELAHKVGLSKSSMSRILGGMQEPRLRLAYDLARALGVTLEYLVDGSPEDHPDARLVVVTEHELAILQIVRRLGSDVSLDRLLAVSPPLYAGQPWSHREDAGRAPRRGSSQGGDGHQA
jgi:transcriptional regulator with XRE-family HTH domain